ncbi:hypothetical protein [Massilia genomosp. 1]|uniref:Uncharacterized protein n=1 Tax=Massilia genomosp. 1 TaxID=2609280 RepID=A0ABX0MJW0_9BURK|nr:hypothetical protein [Massilia genomosp. 1]NHZ62636.1 hypothetical protein [Massilia genomosp. 1]
MIRNFIATRPKSEGAYKGRWDTIRRRRDTISDLCDSLRVAIEEQAVRFGFDLSDDDVCAELIDCGCGDFAGDTVPEMWAKRFLSIAYVSHMRAWDNQDAEESIEDLCLGNWVIGLLGSFSKRDFEPHVCPDCIIQSYKSSVARSGGEGRSAKLKILEKETIRLYLAGAWKSVPLAAQEITPQIVKFSSKGNGDLAATTTKPLEWIREFKQSQKVSAAKHAPPSSKSDL